MRNGAEMAVKAIKSRRQRRVNNGQRVAGGRVRNALMRAGVDLPISKRSGGSNLKWGFSQKSSSNPVSYNASATTVGGKSTSFQKDEVSVILYGMKNYTATIVNIFAGNDYVWPSLTQLASQYTYFWFTRLIVDYIVSSGTATPGNISWCACKTLADATQAATDLSYLQGYTGAYSGSAYKSNTTMYPQTSFNMQYKAQGLAYQPQGEVKDPSDPLKVQGYLVIATSGFTADNTAIGTLKLGYGCAVNSPRCTLSTAPSMCLFDNTTCTSQEDFYDHVEARAPPFILRLPADPAVGSTADTRLIFHSAYDALLHIAIRGVGVSGIDCLGDSRVNCTLLTMTMAADFTETHALVHISNVRDLFDLQGFYPHFTATSTVSVTFRLEGISKVDRVALFEEFGV